MDDFSTRKRFSLKNAATRAAGGSYRFLQPKTKKLLRPAVYASLGVAAALGVQNRDEVKGTVDPEVPTVRALLVEQPTFLAPETKIIDSNTEERLPATIEAKIMICENISNNGKECVEETIYYNEEDVIAGRVVPDGDGLKIQEDHLLTNQERPWVRVSKER